MDYSLTALLAAFAFLYGTVAKGLERTPLGGPVLFMLTGLALGPAGLGYLDMSVEAEQLELLAELTLSFVLFTDAAHANLGVLRRNAALPARMLGIGLPLTLVLGAGSAALLFDNLLPLEIALLAAMLAPTDAALGKAVITNPKVPTNIREALNVESGLNDGICVPLILVLLQLAIDRGAAEDAGGVWNLALGQFASQIGIGALVGLGCASLGNRLVRAFLRRDWTSRTGRQLSVPTLALTCFGTAQTLGGSGFIACFVGGVAFGILSRRSADPDEHELLRVGESVGDVFSLLTWVVFGACVVGHMAPFLEWEFAVYAVLSLTVLRMLPVALSLVGTGLKSDSVLFLGWFGPRGLASIVFLVMVAEEHLPHADTLSAIVTWTVILSVLAHGLSASPLAEVMGRRRPSPPAS